MRIALFLFFATAVATTAVSQGDTTKQIDERQSRYLQNTRTVVDLKRRVATTYDTTGVPLFQSQIAKGWHRVSGEVTLVSGKASVTFNSSPLTGRQDVSFQDSTSYRGHAWSLDTTNTNTYRLYPVSGTRCIILSSDGADAGTVRFVAEGD